MPTGYRIVSGVDLDDVFDPYLQGSKPANTGYRTADGVDLNQRYAPRVYGQQAAATGYRLANGADLNTLWAKKGTAAYKLACDGQTAAAAEQLNNQQSGYARAEFVANTDGTYVLRTVRSPNPQVNDTTVVSAGTWNTLGGAAANYQVRYTLTNIQYPAGTSVGASTSNDAAAFTTVSAARTVSVGVNGAFNSGTREITADLKIELRRASDGVVFSTTNVHLSAHIDGSV